MEQARINGGWILRTAGVVGFLGVALGAFGAHALSERLQAAGRVETWETAVLYHLVHAVALMVLAVMPAGSLANRVAVAWTAGVAIFSGSLYILCLTGVTWMGAITPVGGLAFLVGWGLLAVGMRRG